MITHRLAAIVALTLSIQACGGEDAAAPPAAGAGAGAGGASTAKGGGAGTSTGGSDGIAKGGDSAGAGTGGTGGTGGTSGAGGTGGTGGTGGAGGMAGTGGTGGGSGPGPTGAPFRYGINYGHLNAKWGDAEDSTLAARAGCTSARVKLPETHLTTWGYDIEVGDMKTYASNGMTNHVAFLSTPTKDHSTMPGGEPDWKLEWYKPIGLYEPTFLPNGEINPKNPWAAYVFKTVSAYKDHVHVWQVWNEPDWTPDYNVTLTWDKQPPQAKDLPRWNGSIFEYVRMLRVTMEAARKADPTARIALGGLGYPSFLNAVLRYTDEPNAGAVTTDFPKKGGDYFDVLDYHYYPVFSPGSSDVGVDGFVKLKGEMAAELSKAGVSGKAWNVTETGAPSEAVGKATGSPVYARSYLVKTMVRAQAEGIEGVDWFLLANVNKTNDSFARMGLYEPIENLAKVDDAKITPTGTAYKTLSKTLGKARFDAGATAALGPQSGDVVAYAFTGDGPRRVVAWARTKGTDEAASGTVSFPAAGSVQEIAWDGAARAIAPSGGTISAPVDGSPVIFVDP